MAELGKLVGENLYVHLEAVELLSAEDSRRLIEFGLAALPMPARDRANVAKVNRFLNRVSFLEYANFEEDAFPVLKASWTLQCSGGSSFSYRSYEEAANPPILHRKELLVGESHPLREEWAGLTQVAQELGLFDDPGTIGFQLNWERAIERRGYKLVGGTFQPVGNVIETEIELSSIDGSVAIQRHLTALARTNISAPVQLLLRHGLLSKSNQFFDYGCGRGDDVESLVSDGFAARGWDPHFAPDNPVPSSADVVNLGFVVNVIEDAAERVEALSRAFSICKGVMSVGVMLYGPDRTGRPFGDGVLTSRGTFQKYFSQEELKDYVEQVLHAEAFMVAPGIAFVFADKNLEQSFLASRYRTKSVSERLLVASRRTLLNLSSPRRVKRESGEGSQARNRETQDGASSRRAISIERRLALARPLLDSVWRLSLELGRYPEPADLPAGLQLQPQVRSLTRAIRLVQTVYDQALLARARQARIDDLRLYFAMQHFAKRPRYKHLEARLQRDIRCFFADYPSATAAGIRLLTEAADVQSLLASARRAAEAGLGWLDGEHSLQIHVDLVDRLPVVLRAFVSCGLVLSGGVSQASLVKIHLTSAKLSLMEFDDFSGTPLPRMTRRVKVNLRRLAYEVFEYGTEFPKPVLYFKSRFMHEDLPGYAEQLAFDEALETAGAVGPTKFGLAAEELTQLLERKRLEIRGTELIASTTIPDIDSPCGAHLTYRNLIQCGETRERLGLANLPSRPETYNALYGLATHILDPLIDYFGSIKLTYGFCSRDLGRHIKSRVSPDLDQHAAEELKPSGKPICERGGAACDFLVENEDMREVAEWLMDNLPFDRLYYYGPERPLHVSWSNRGGGESYEMVPTQTGRRVPRRFLVGQPKC